MSGSVERAGVSQERHLISRQESARSSCHGNEVLAAVRAAEINWHLRGRRMKGAGRGCRTVLLPLRGKWHNADDQVRGSCLHILCVRNPFTRQKGEAAFWPRIKMGFDSSTERWYWVLFYSSNPTNLTPHLSVCSALPLQLHSTCSQCYKNKRWREAAALISSLTYSLKAAAAQREKKEVFFRRILPEDGLCGAWLLNGPHRTTSEGQWSSAPAGAETWRQVWTGQR